MSVSSRLGLWTVLGPIAIAGGAIYGCGDSPDDCVARSNCPTADAGEGGAETGLTDGPVEAPPGCDPSAEPKDAPKCVVNDFGVFVDATGGSDSNPGTREAPVKTIASALAKRGAKPRVYVCEGTYPERVTLSAAVSLYGGFACGAWTYAGTKPKVAPTEPGYALELGDVAGDVTVADLAFTAPSAQAKGASSIAVFAHRVQKLTLLRAELEAGNATDGDDGEAGATGTVTAVTGGGPLDYAGYPASGTTAGPVKTCTCSTGGTTSGAGGGAPAGAGALGQPNLGGAAPNDGAGGLASTSCVVAEPNGSGNFGADKTSATDAPKSTSLGALDAAGWKPQAGAAGPSGAPGQGGGGGGGRDGAGGGGGCGGCGGSGGKGGKGGGASIALLAFETPVTLRASKLVAKNAGRGGAGGAKGTGALGGGGNVGGVAAPFAGCPGGDGGRGGDGGTGAGGAGGVSAAILYKGPAPSNEASTLTPGTKGEKGTGGTPGANDGPDGLQSDILPAP